MANSDFRPRLLLSLLAGLVLGSCGAPSPEPVESDAATRSAALVPVGPAPVFCIFPAWIPAFMGHCGDVTISNQADADQYQAIVYIAGNLTIKAGRKLTQTDSWGNKFYAPGLELSMPHLAEVTGDLVLDGDRTEEVSLPQLARVGRDLMVTSRRFFTYAAPSTYNGLAVNVIKTPALTTVGRHITLRATRDAHASTAALAKFFEFGFDQVTEVGGDVSIENATLPGSVQGLRALAAIEGNLAIDWKNNDLTSSELLTHVTSVAGNVTLRTSSYARFLMSELSQVGGELEIRANPPATTLLQSGGVFPKLTRVGGDFRLSNTAPGGCTNELPSLRRVVGSIVIDNAQMTGYFGRTGTTHLRAGGIQISNSRGSIPFFPDLQLSPSAAVALENNPELCPCTIDAFATSLAAAGFTGTLVDSGNGDGTCTSCPTCP